MKRMIFVLRVARILVLLAGVGVSTWLFGRTCPYNYLGLTQSIVRGGVAFIAVLIGVRASRKLFPDILTPKLLGIGSAVFFAFFCFWAYLSLTTGGGGEHVVAIAAVCAALSCPVTVKDA